MSMAKLSLSSLDTDASEMFCTPIGAGFGLSSVFDFFEGMSSDFTGD